MPLMVSLRLGCLSYILALVVLRGAFVSFVLLVLAVATLGGNLAAA